MKEYFLDISTVSQEALTRWYRQMQPERRAKCDRLIKPLAKKQCIAADRLMRVALSEALNLPKDQIFICVSPEGKPYLENNPVYFSVSHSENIVVCVVSHRPIGVDVELIRPISPSAQEKICTDTELEYLRAAKNDEERLYRFFTLWTRKEALFKMDCSLCKIFSKTDVLTSVQPWDFITKKEKNFLISIVTT